MLIVRAEEKPKRSTEPPVERYEDGAAIRWPRPRPEREEYERAGVPLLRWSVSGPGAPRPDGLQVDGKRGVHLLDGLIPSVRIQFYRAQQDRLEIDIYIPVGFDARE